MKLTCNFVFSNSVIFVLYEALPDPCVNKMEHVVNTAMDIVFLLSFTVSVKALKFTIRNFSQSQFSSLSFPASLRRLDFLVT